MTTLSLYMRSGKVDSRKVEKMVTGCIRNEETPEAGTFAFQCNGQMLSLKWQLLGA